MQWQFQSAETGGTWGQTRGILQGGIQLAADGHLTFGVLAYRLHRKLPKNPPRGRSLTQYRLGSCTGEFIELIGCVLVTQL